MHLLDKLIDYEIGLKTTQKIIFVRSYPLNHTTIESSIKKINLNSHVMEHSIILYGKKVRFPQFLNNVYFSFSS